MHWRNSEIIFLPLAPHRSLGSKHRNAWRKSCFMWLPTRHRNEATMDTETLKIAANVVGWIYFACWTASFYPQVYKNWKRQSVVGFSFDYLALNIAGYVSYSFYTLTVYFDRAIQEYFHKMEKQSSSDQDNTVKLTDVVFATHGLAICVVEMLQCFMYERGNQRLSRGTLAIIMLLLAGLLGGVLVAAFSTDSLSKWAWTLSYSGYCKSGVSFVKVGWMHIVVYTCRNGCALFK